MAFYQYLNFNGLDLPLPVSYDIDLSAVEADTTGETEAGTRLSGVGALSHATAIRSVDMRARIKMKTLDFFIIAPIIPLIANRIREAL